ncbi:hypothetical protein FRX31_019247 [Thalictrum thalictroides]|uniref:Ankyrin repeat-containing protein n=1 Tax=Thalictrum thalictroides TaxID=46969 RepID=A0A7J6W192_THATH|nr:hypothetical protein FRX31_019247 [Thalictrum thalictroides]
MDAIERAKRGDLKFLKEAPLDILLNARDSNDDTVLSMVVYDNRLDCCEVICERCPSLLYHQPRQGGNTPLHHAAYWGYLDILKLLISTCDKADQEGDRAGKPKTLTLRTTSYGDNAMHKATHGSQPESVKLLIEADPNKELLRAGDRKNNTPLHLAVGLKSDLEIARLLIKADPDFPYGANSDRKTPLLIAIEKAEWHHDREMLKLMLELQPTQTKVRVNENGWTALHYSVYKNFLDTIGYIIQSCPESSKVPDNEGQNFFHHAVKLGNMKMVKHILGMKEITSTVLNSPDNLGRTPWDVAAVSRNETDPDFPYGANSDGKTPLLIAIDKAEWQNDREMLELILELQPTQSKVSVHESGWTALHYSVSGGFLHTIGCIIQSCPESSKVVDNEGQNFFHHAVKLGNVEMVKHILGMKEITSTVLNSPDNLGRTPWDVAAVSRNETGAKSYNEYAEDDIESGGGEKTPQKMLLTMVDDQGDTALHKAVLNHKLEAVKLLVEADPDYEYGANTYGDSPIMISVREARLYENKFDTGNHHMYMYMLSFNPSI